MPSCFHHVPQLLLHVMSTFTQHSACFASFIAILWINGYSGIQALSNCIFVHCQLTHFSYKCSCEEGLNFFKRYTRSWNSYLHTCIAFHYIAGLSYRFQKWMWRRKVLVTQSQRILPSVQRSPSPPSHAPWDLQTWCLRECWILWDFHHYIQVSRDSS